jgi:hypothetical protein
MPEVLDIDELVDALARQVGPFHSPPNMFVPYHVKREALYRAFAGVELGAWDSRVLSWLANADGDTVLALLGMVHRAMTDAAERAGRGELVTECYWCSPSGVPLERHHPGGQVAHIPADE